MSEAVDDDDYDAGQDCGRWDQRVGLADVCALASTEFCDWDCPYSRLIREPAGRAALATADRRGGGEG